MDFGFSKDQELIRKSAREFFEKECPKDKVRELKSDPKGYDPKMWKKMVDLGFLEEEPILVGGKEVSPRQFVHDLLEPQLQYGPTERDIAGLRIEVVGLKNGKSKRVIYQMIDRRDLETGLLAMQRTVGYTASIGAQMVLNGQITKRGLLTPTRDIPSDILIEELENRGITIQRTESDA